MASRKGAGKVHAEWRDVLQELDSAQSRRWKSAAKQSNVNIVSVTEQGIEARVKWHNIGGGKRTFSLRVPVVSWWASYRSQVVIWLARRPDWQAAFLANEWDDDFLQFLSGTGLSLFPTEDYLQQVQNEAVCSCAVPENPCIHMMAMFETLMREQEIYPYKALEYVGLPFASLLDDVHAKTAEWLLEKHSADNHGFPETKTEVSSSELSKTEVSEGAETATEQIQSSVSFWPEERELMKRLQSEPTVDFAGDSRFPLNISKEQLEKWGKNTGLT
ncbi:hypothetical protein [Alicyclobacillus sp. SO9]|uniref:hypothetical protein n=1 Tax=Alicyclobacillus sp. SO9 TaxID=2665646 RepID=UPI0018E78A14|nr:hypothetical protein [Alicyclobacillus sp. SO9]QQE80334.1 hypothetical protein GI364_07900 [Alicyclobacillus sp. SO9]